MNTHSKAEDFGTLIEPTTLKIERMLPGPIERVWSYVTQEDLRRQWFASGEMKLKRDAPFELVWRNAELSSNPGKRPKEIPEEHRMQSRIISCEPPHSLAFTWGEKADVAITLQARGSKVLLTLIHRRLATRGMTVGVSAGWHSHLDLLVAILNGAETQPFWDNWSSLKQEYDQRIPN
jgi:uncharacterized protein YndB with AHSA1/START domain